LIAPNNPFVTTRSRVCPNDKQVEDEYVHGARVRCHAPAPDRLLIAPNGPFATTRTRVCPNDNQFEDEDEHVARARADGSDDKQIEDEDVHGARARRHAPVPDRLLARTRYPGNALDVHASTITAHEHGVPCPAGR
jgi:hypothetical protein